MRNYSLAAIEQLLTSTPARCSVKRSKTGRITACQLFPLPENSQALEGKEKLRKTFPQGQHYSFWEPLYSGPHAWTPVYYLLNRHEEEEQFLQGVFRAVPLSCTVASHVGTPPEEPPPAARVVEMKPKKTTLACYEAPVPLAA